MQASADTFDVVAFPHPLLSVKDAREVHEGATIAQIVEQSGIAPNYLPHVHVVISHGLNSSVVPVDMWNKVRPRKGCHVLIAPKVEAPVLGAVLAAVLPSVASWAAGQLFVAGTVLAQVVTAAFTIVGALAIQALIPPPSLPRPQEQKATYSITGISNAENPYGVYPTVLGRHHMYPPKTARGYTETVEQDIYYRGRFTFGYGPVILESLKIGQTPIWEFEGVQLEFLNVQKERTLANMPELEPLVRPVRNQFEDRDFTIYREGSKPNKTWRTGITNAILNHRPAPKACRLRSVGKRRSTARKPMIAAGQFCALRVGAQPGLTRCGSRRGKSGRPNGCRSRWWPARPALNTPSLQMIWTSRSGLNSGWRLMAVMWVG